MAVPAKEPPGLALWAATLGATTAPQYIAQVRKFFGTRSDPSLRSVTRDELVGYCAAVDVQQTRWKIMGALDSFFEFVERHDGISHPAPGLAKKVSALRDRRELERGLVEGGASARRAAVLKWRDVARDIVGPKAILPRNLDNQIRLRLIAELLDRMRSASPETIAAVLDVDIFD
jgi:hypothetical protein